MRRHALHDSSRKMPSMKYYGNNRTIEITVRMVTAYGRTKFVGVVREFDCTAEDENVDRMYQKICALLDEKTLIQWKPFLRLSLDAGVEIDFNNGNQRRVVDDKAIHISFDLEVVQIEIGKNSKGDEVFREAGSSRIEQGRPAQGIDIRKHEAFGLELRTLDSVVPDTPQNREALILLAGEFERIRERLQTSFAPEVVQKTLTAAVTGGLLTAAPAEAVQPTRSTKQRKTI